MTEEERKSINPEEVGTMSDLNDTISRQAAIDAIIKADYEFTGILSEPRARRFEQTINALPSAQPEIIRCRDCKHWQSEEHIGNNNVHTLAIASLPCKNWLTGGDWYCGSAERRTDA